MTTTVKTKRIAELNDQFRKTFSGGMVLRTSGILALAPKQRAEILEEVMAFNDFTPDNNPHGERDFGAFDKPGVGKVFWKIDCYDGATEYGSPDPANPEITRRVLTIMLAEEY